MSLLLYSMEYGGDIYFAIVHSYEFSTLRLVSTYVELILVIIVKASKHTQTHTETHTLTKKNIFALFLFLFWRVVKDSCIVIKFCVLIFFFLNFAKHYTSLSNCDVLCFFFCKKPWLMRKKNNKNAKTTTDNSNSIIVFMCNLLYIHPRL